MMRSQGETTISDEDVKMAILALRGMIHTQQLRIETLTDEEIALKSKKKPLRKPLKK